MHYSCFDQSTGLYRVFQDARMVPVNGDMPLPQLGADVNGIGVPSVEASRPVPPDAQFVRTSWQPVGMMANCGSSAAVGFGTDDAAPSAGGVVLASVVLAVAGAAAVYLIWRNL